MGLLWNQLGSLSYEVLYVVKPDGTGEGSETAQDHSLQQKKTLKKRPEAHEPSVYLVYRSHEICSYEWADVPVVGLRCFFLYPSALPVPQSKTVFLESGFKPSAG